MLDDQVSGSYITNFINNARLIPKYLNSKTMSIGAVSALMACTGPILVVMTVAQNGNLLPQQTTSWLFGIYFFGGLIGIIVPLLTGTPIAGAWSIPSAVLLTTAITQYKFTELIGAYLIAGLIIFFIGIFGLFEKLLARLPMELVMAMIAGSLIHFATDMVKSVSNQPLVGGLTVLTYFVFTKYFVKIPPIIGALAVSLILNLILGQPLPLPEFSFQLPSIWLPEFAFSTVLAVSLPIAIMTLGCEGAQGISVAKNAGYKPPVNLITMINGVGTMLASIFGAHSACIAGMMTALCCSKEAGEKDGRYVAAWFSGVLMCIFGLSASIALSFILLMPPVLMKLIAGLVLIYVILTSLQRSFRGRQFQLGAFFSLIIALSGVNFYGIGATFWALAGGWLISWFMENKDFEKHNLSVIKGSVDTSETL